MGGASVTICHADLVTFPAAMVNCWRCVAVVFGVVAAVVSNELADEAFEEDLLVKPLPDGKVLSKFTFKTLLKGATPRRPSRPGLDDDERELNDPLRRLAAHRRPSAALHAVPSRLG